MIIGVPKEIKPDENRVALTPSGANSLIQKGHTVCFQKSAGVGSGFTDDDYLAVGAQLKETIEEVYACSEMIIKVKEPIEQEYALIRKNQLLFTYFHFASSEALTQAMIKSESICLAYETVELANGTLPLLTPMSEIAGRMSIQEGAKYLEKPMGGQGTLLGGVPGVAPAYVMVLGGGVVGTQAAKMAAGLGAQVLLFDVNLDRLRYLQDIMPANVIVLYSNPFHIEQWLSRCSLIVGAVLLPGARAPRLISRDMLSKMREGSVLVDVAVDQGGCIETCKPTTHANPIYTIDGIVHYCVANMPGAVPRTSTQALTNATLGYAIELAEKGWKEACRQNILLAKGLNIVHTKVCYQGVADAFDLSYTPVEDLL